MTGPARAGPVILIDVLFDFLEDCPDGVEILVREPSTIPVTLALMGFPVRSGDGEKVCWSLAAVAASSLGSHEKANSGAGETAW